jgi:hypothetical protein
MTEPSFRVSECGCRCRELRCVSNSRAGGIAVGRKKLGDFDEQITAVSLSSLRRKDRRPDWNRGVRS